MAGLATTAGAQGGTNHVARAALACVLLSWALLAARFALDELFEVESALDWIYFALVALAPILAGAGLLLVRRLGEGALAGGVVLLSLLLPGAYFVFFLFVLLINSMLGDIPVD